MAYRVEFTGRAARDLAYIYEHIRAADSPVASRWFNGLEAAVDRFEGLPRRCAVAPEAKRTGRTLRQLLYGNRPNIYRIIYEIDEGKRVVSILAIRHGARELAQPEDLR
jgi:toxin ParE1/3/4